MHASALQTVPEATSEPEERTPGHDHESSTRARWEQPLLTTSLFVVAAVVLLATIFMAVQFHVHRTPSMVGVTFLVLLVMHGITAVPFAMGIWGQDLPWFVPISPDFPWVIAATFAAYALGAALASEGLRFDLPRRHAAFFARPLEPAEFGWLPYAAASTVAIIVSVYYAYGAGGRTGIEMLSASTREGATLREFRLAFREANPYYYVGSLASQIFDPILMLVALAQARLAKSMWWSLTAVLLFGVNLLAATAELHKAPLAILVLYGLLCWMQSGSSRIASSRFFVLSGAVLLAVGSVGYYFTYDIEAGEAWQATIDRIVLVPQMCVNWFLYVYPRLIDFDNGLGVGLVAKIVGVRDYVSPPYAVSQIITGEPNTSANAMWSTEFWASFGYPGVVLGSMLVGALMVLLDWWCLERRRTATAVALYSFLIVTAIKVPSGSIFTALLSGGIGLGPLFVFLVLERRPAGLHLAPAR
jgi:hypothetical protein